MSSYHLGTLDAFTDVMKIISEKLDDGERYNIQRVFFSTMFQSGVDGFRFYGDHERIVESDFIKKRIVIENYTEVWKLNTEIKDIISRNYLKLQLNSSEPNPLSYLNYFLTDLILALHSKRSMVTTVGIPKLFELDKYLKPEFILLLNNLFKSVSTINIESTIPLLTFEKTEIKIFEEILNSDLFKDYVQSQRELENKDNKIVDVVPYIKDKSINLIKKFRQNIGLKDYMIKVVDLSNSVTEMFGNKLTSLLSNNLNQSFKNILNNNKRIVIYSFDNVFFELLKQRLGKIKKVN